MNELEARLLQLADHAEAKIPTFTEPADSDQRVALRVQAAAYRHAADLAAEYERENA